MASARQRKRRQRRHAERQRSEPILPTPERLAKGNVVRLPSGQIKCTNVTFVDQIINENLFSRETDKEDIQFSLAFMLDLTERSGLFASATRSISELSFVRGGYNVDMSAADEWRHILNFLNSDAKRTMVDLLSDSRPRSLAFLLNKINCFRELSRIVENFRFRQNCLTKSEI